MATFTELILIEIDGPDVLTWHLAYDPYPQVRYFVRTSGATELVVIDTEGQQTDLTYEFTTDDVRVEFHKRSDYYTVLHRRRNFVTAAGAGWRYQDAWPPLNAAYFTWFFPPGSQVQSLEPALLTPHLAQWNTHPLLAQPLTGVTLIADYQAGTDRADAVLPAAAVDLDRLLCDLAPPHGTEAEILCRHMLRLAEVDALLGTAPALRALLAQKLDLNLDAPGTRAFVR